MRFAFLAWRSRAVACTSNKETPLSTDPSRVAPCPARSAAPRRGRLRSIGNRTGIRIRAARDVRAPFRGPRDFPVEDSRALRECARDGRGAGGRAIADRALGRRALLRTFAALFERQGNRRAPRLGVEEQGGLERHRLAHRAAL